MDKIYNIDAYEIQKYQQNRYPLLFVDRIDEALPGKYAKGVKHFTYNEWFFPAHFEDEPNVPGFIQLEVLSQVFLMTFLTLPECKGKKTAFVKVKDLVFKKKLVPGIELKVEAELHSFKRGVAKGEAKGFVSGELACQAEFIIAVPDILFNFRPKK